MGKIERVRFDIASALTRTGEDRALFQELVGIFTEESPKLLAEISDSIARRDYDTLVRAAHTLKGRAAFFGAETLESLAVKLETMGRKRRLSAPRNTLTAITTEMDHLMGSLSTGLVEQS